MKKLLVFFMILALLLTSLPLGTILAENGIKIVNDLQASSDDNYLVKYKNDDKRIKIEEKIASNGGKANRTFKKSRVVKAKLTPGLVTELKNDPDVELIEPDSKISAHGETIPWGVAKINAPEAHRQGSNGEKVKAAIFDTGISNHPDLEIKGGVSFVDGITSYNDDNGHGTHLAGILASEVNNKGLVGVAPGVDLYAVKVLKSDGTGSYSSIIEALEWAVENDINIINMSFGSPQYSRILEDAINQAYENNILIFASA